MTACAFHSTTTGLAPRFSDIVKSGIVQPILNVTDDVAVRNDRIL